MGAFDGVRRQRSLAFVIELVDRGVAYLAPDCHSLSAGQPVASSGCRKDRGLLRLLDAAHERTVVEL